LSWKTATRTVKQKISWKMALVAWLWADRALAARGTSPPTGE
jgi:hypothetical protein